MADQLIPENYFQLARDAESKAALKPGTIGDGWRELADRYRKLAEEITLRQSAVHDGSRASKD